MKNENSNLGKDLVGSAADGGRGKVLHSQFVKLGNQRRILTNELLALLPEIYQCGIFKKYARTIEEYAARFGGLSPGVAQKRLRLEKYLHDKPDLRDAILTEGVHKVALVASLATVSNQAALADKVKNMSKPAVQELSKELRAGLLAEGSAEGGENRSLFEVGVIAGVVVDGGGAMGSGAALKSVSCKAIPTKITIELDEEMSFLFLKLKKMLGKNLSNREVMKIMMERLLGQLTDKKVVPGDGFLEQEREGKFVESLADVEKNSGKDGQENFQNEDNPKSHYIAVALRREKLVETNGKCSYPGCNKPAENFHHTERYSEHKNHKSIKPLCKIHHEFMHNALVLNQTDHQSDWQLSLDAELSYADYFYRIYRKGGG